MDEKNKIILRDRKKLEIEQGGSAGAVVMHFANLQDFESTLETFKPANLEAYQVQNQEEIMEACPENKECVRCSLDFTWNGEGVLMRQRCFISRM